MLPNKSLESLDSIERESTQSLNLLKNQKKLNIWTIFSSTFITIFLAEMGDKTQLTTLFLSAESASPWVVFIGAGLALISTSLVGVLIGYWLAKRVSHEILDLALSLLFLLVAAGLIDDIIS
jgi:putative Ca2+/H+ antiporter (TMEM165/GDT1 family)